MKAPRCRVCGQVHWSTEPHSFAPDPPARPVEVAIKAPRKLTPANKLTVSTCPHCGQRMPTTPEARRAYMRDLMRRRRCSPA